MEEGECIGYPSPSGIANTRLKMTESFALSFHSSVCLPSSWFVIPGTVLVYFTEVFPANGTALHETFSPFFKSRSYVKERQGNEKTKPGKTKWIWRKEEENCKVLTRIRIRGSSGSADLYHWIVDPYPALFFSGFQVY
jgi:hypothetical protein